MRSIVQSSVGGAIGVKKCAGVVRLTSVRRLQGSGTVFIANDDSIQWLYDVDMLTLLKGERVISPSGQLYVVITSAGEKGHPELWPNPGILSYPTRVFRDRRTYRG